MDEPVVAQAGPFVLPVRAGRRYLWCACGRSTKQPLCNGAHAGTSILPLFYAADATGEIALCGCKRTRTPPLCDGSHRALTGDKAAQVP